LFNHPGKLGGDVNTVPSEGSDGGKRIVVSDNEQGSVGNVNVPEQEQHEPEADELVEGKNDGWRYV
jgi:hypothetical protein